MRSVIELLEELKKQRIKLSLKGDEIEVTSYKNELAKDQIQSIKDAKKDIVAYLKTIEANQLERSIPNVEINEDYIISNAQKRVWILSQIKESSIAYNLPTVLELEGGINPDLLEHAILSVIERHEILRTIFKEDESGGARQIVLPFEDYIFTMGHKDYSEEKNPKIAAQDYIDSDSYKPFDLSQGPLFRASLLKITDQKFVFYYNMHHIISDGWSMKVLAKDVMRFYEMYDSGTTSKIKPLKIQYKDYAAWQSSQLEDPSIIEDKKYWLSQLEGTIHTLDLPSSLSRPKVKTYNGKSIGVFIKSDLIERLAHFTREKEGTLFMGLLAVAKLLLYRYTGEKDNCIGNPIAGREHMDLEDQIGVYINTLVLRDTIDPKDNFGQLFEKIKSTLLIGLKHQMYPFDKVLEDLKISREPSRNPIFDILINHLGISNTPTDGLKENGLNDLGIKRVLFDLDLTFIEVNEGVEFIVNYNVDVYEQTMIERFMKHYINLLDKVLSDTTEPIGKIEYLSKSESLCLLEEFNLKTPETPINKTLIELFDNQVQRQPSKTAVVSKGKKMSYGELEEISNKFAKYLGKEHNIQTEDLVGVLLERDEWLIISMLAVLKLGAAYIPIDKEYPEKRIQFIKEDSDSKVCIDENIIKEFEESIDSFSGENLEIETNPNEVAYVIYTSGTTGEPKGVVIEHRSIANYISQMKLNYSIEENENVILISNHVFDASVEQIYIALLSGATLHIPTLDEVKNLSFIQNYLKENKITHIHATPSYLEILPEDEYIDLKRIVSGGEKCTVELFNKWNKKHSFINKYGPTETCVSATVFHAKKGNKKDKSIPIGKPINHTQVYILGKEKEILPIGVVGEIYIAGEGLAREYLNRENLTAEKFIENPHVKGQQIYKSGDLGNWLPDGNIQYVGRIDNQVKIRGYRIELGEIESILNEVKQITRSVVVVTENDSGTKTMVAFVVKNQPIEDKEIINLLKIKLPEFMIPTIYVDIEEVPLTSNGKIDKKALVIPEITGDSATIVLPYTETQTKLLEIWKNVLMLDEISITSDFFQLGGNSLHAIRIINGINKKFELNYDLRNAYVENTIELFAEKIDIDLRFKIVESLEESEFDEIKI